MERQIESAPVDREQEPPAQILVRADRFSGDMWMSCQVRSQAPI